MIAVKLDKLDDFIREIRKKKLTAPLYITLDYVEGTPVAVDGKNYARMIAMIKLSTVLSECLYFHTTIVNQQTIKSEDEFKQFSEQADAEYNRISSELRKEITGVVLLRGSVGVV